MNYLALALLLTLTTWQDDVPPNRVVAIVIPTPVAQADTYGGPITDAIVRRLDAMQKAWADRDGVVAKLIAELEARQEKRNEERFMFIKQWLENLRPGPIGPVDVGPVREFFTQWQAERDRQQAETLNLRQELRAWREDREERRKENEVAAGERKTLLERMAEQRAALIEARTAAIEARAAAAAAEAQAQAALQQTGPIREGLKLLVNLVWAVIVLIVVVAVLGFSYRIYMDVRAISAIVGA